MSNSKDYLVIILEILTLIAVAFVLIPTIETAFNIPNYTNDFYLKLINLISSSTTLAIIISTVLTILSATVSVINRQLKNRR